MTAEAGGISAGMDAVWDEVRRRLRATLNAATYDFAIERARPLHLFGHPLARLLGAHPQRERCDAML